MYGIRLLNHLCVGFAKTKWRVAHNPLALDKSNLKWREVHFYAKNIENERLLYATGNFSILASQLGFSAR